jgi:DNA-binding MarR family transcriptional regulator
VEGALSPELAEVEHAAAFRAELRRFLARTDSVTAEAGLTTQRYDLLLAIKAAGGQASINELCTKLEMRQTAVTELVKRAQEAGLVVRTRSTTDRRVVHVSVTDEAETRLWKVFESLRADRASLASALEHLRASLDSPPALHPALEPPAGVHPDPPPPG